MLIPSIAGFDVVLQASLSRRVNANSQLNKANQLLTGKLIKKGEC